MSLSIGIIGLPNVGKSTLFNALLKRQIALAANYPFATIEPNIGVVEVPDERLQKLAELVNPEKITPTTIKFYDIAGLVKGASEGAGLGNKFLSHIREVDAIVHVVRSFDDANIVREGSVNPEEDIQTINTELILADIQMLQGRISKHEGEVKKAKTAENIKKADLYTKLLNHLNEGKLVRDLNLSEDEQELSKDLNLLTIKPILTVFNVGEGELSKYYTQNAHTQDSNNSKLYLSAKIESELSALSEDDQKLYLKELNIPESGLDLVIKESYRMLGLQTFLTAGPKEVRAWTIRKGTKAPQAAGVIHTDFERGFICAETISFNDLIKAQNHKKAKELGLVRLEGKNYVMQDGDVVEFRFNV